jgi:uncharacterized integral membrane protein
MTGDWNSVPDPSAIAAVASGTRSGHIWLARIGGLILLWLLSLFGREPKGAVSMVQITFWRNHSVLIV